MSDGVSPGFMRDFDEALRYKRAGDARAEQVVALVAGIGAHHWKDEIAHELLSNVFDEDMFVGNAHCAGLLARGFDFLALAEIGSEGDDFAGRARLPAIWQ